MQIQTTFNELEMLISLWKPRYLKSGFLSASSCKIDIRYLFLLFWNVFLLKKTVTARGFLKFPAMSKSFNFLLRHKDTSMSST